MGSAKGRLGKVVWLRGLPCWVQRGQEQRGEGQADEEQREGRGC